MRGETLMFKNWQWMGCLGMLVAVAAGPLWAADEDGFVPIFDGKTGQGWSPRPDPGGKVVPDAWVIENGELVNKCKGCWYRYDEPLENFALRLQFKVSPNANSGIVLHAAKEGVPWQSGFEVQILDDHGKDPGMHTTGAIYDVVTAMYNESKPTGEWNDMEIVLDGPLTKVWVNGLKLIDTDFSKLTEPVNKFKKYKLAYANLPRSGYIFLQDHGQPMWFRNIRVKKLPPGYRVPSSAPAHDEAAFEPLLTATQRDGWAVYRDNGKEPFKLNHEGVLHCRGTWGPWYRYEARQLDNFVLRMDFRTTLEGAAPESNPHSGNSGVVVRASKDGDPPYSGFEVQIFADAGKPPMKHGTGAIYDIVTPMFNASNPVGEWNQLELTCDGPLCVVMLNGWKVIDTDFSKLTMQRGKFNFPYAQLPKTGYLCLQDHGDLVEFRNIRVKPLK